MANLLLLDGCTFFLSQENGDVEANRPQAFFFNDVRHLSQWQLLVDGEPLTPTRAPELLGLDIVAGKLRSRPRVPEELGRDPTEGRPCPWSSRQSTW